MSYYTHFALTCGKGFHEFTTMRALMLRRRMRYWNGLKFWVGSPTYSEWAHVLAGLRGDITTKGNWPSYPYQDGTHETPFHREHFYSVCLWATINYFKIQNKPVRGLPHHYDSVTMSVMASQITSLNRVYSTAYIFYSGTGERKHQSSALLAFVRGIHRWPVNTPHKWPVTWKMFLFHDIIMTSHKNNSWEAGGCVSWRVPRPLHEDTSMHSVMTNPRARY